MEDPPAPHTVAVCVCVCVRVCHSVFVRVPVCLCLCPSVHVCVCLGHRTLFRLSLIQMTCIQAGSVCLVQSHYIIILINNNMYNQYAELNWLLLELFDVSL